MSKSATEEIEPHVVKNWDVGDISTILAEIERFKMMSDDHISIGESITIKIYSNGKVEISGDFTTYESREIVV